MTEISKSPNTVVRFIPIGDSLSAGHGARAGESWPEVLTRNLKKENLAFELVTNPARSGYNSQQALDYEIPVFEKNTPTLGSLLIGSNDMARGVAVSTFAQNLKQILDRMQKTLPDPSQLLLFNLPDFTATPAARKYRGQLHMQPYMQEFNSLIEKEASDRGLAVFDLYKVSQDLGSDARLYSFDGLHPSGLGYAAWELLIRPEIKKLLGQ